MAYHKSNLGGFGYGVQADMNGYVPEEGDGPFALSYDHGTELTHDEYGELTEYGEWWVEDGYPEILAAAIKATAAAVKGLSEWQDKNA